MVTSDREVSRFAERMAVSVIPSEQFLAEDRTNGLPATKGRTCQEEEEERGERKKGPSRRLSKKERRKTGRFKKTLSIQKIDNPKSVLGFPLIFGSLDEAGNIGLMPVENQGGNEDTEDEIGLGITPEKGDQDGNRGGTGDRS